jgi:4-amino-4-deoxychorismate lyase
MLINGKAASQVPATDRGLAYGDGLFETLAVLDGQPLHWRRHMARMTLGCARLDLPMPDPDLWLSEARKVLGGRRCTALKLMLTRGLGPRGYRPPASPEPTRIVMGLEGSAPPAAWRVDGLRVRLCHMRLSRNPRLAGLKHLNRLEQVLARAEWQDEYQEGIMLDTEDHVVEATMSNLFLIREDALYTPLLDECGVAGITRARVMDAATALDIPVHEARVRMGDLDRVQGLFLTGTLIGLCPVAELDGHMLACPPMIRRLQTALEEGAA